MANELAVLDANGVLRLLRSEEIGSGSNAHAQVVLVQEMREVPPNISGAVIRYTINNNTAIQLTPPSAGAWLARVRVYDTVGPFADPSNPYRRLYYRTDGTNPLNDGSNAFGFLMHGEQIPVKLSNFTNFRMARDSTDLGTFAVYVEWVNIPSS